MTERPRQIHLAAHFPGVNNTTVWSDPEAGSHIEFSSFVKLAQTAERAKFDFFFLAEGLRLREQRGKIHDLDVVGRPDTFTVLAGLAAVTDRIGLSGTINSTFNEPYEVARQFASLDHLSEGRAAWNVVTSWDAFTGENFRRGGFLAREDRYDRAKEFLDTARELWDSWDEGAIVADKEAGRFIVDPDQGDFAHHGRPVRHLRALQRAPLTAGPSGHLPGRRLRHRSGVRRRRLPTASSPGTGRSRPGSASTRTSRAAWPATGGRRTTSRSFPPPPSSSATPRPTPWSVPP